MKQACDAKGRCPSRQRSKRQSYFEQLQFVVFVGVDQCKRIEVGDGKRV
jgi:hypothetical protein